MLKKDKSELTDIEYIFTQENGTEPPFMNEYWNHIAKGIYVEKISGKPLFTNEEKINTECVM
ncbi:peptide-methionine (R)-S-oxide reductase, partial [Staphylococcus aureus]|nr:peptide-methionine (R)-S-oxide reductase [Staphylococcus aureus]